MKPWQLIIHGPGYQHAKFNLAEGVTALGRADENDIVLSGDSVSRRHARITVRKGVVTFEDVGSRNGSELNGKSVTDAVIVLSGDEVQVGENKLLIHEIEDHQKDLELVDAAVSSGIRRLGNSFDSQPSSVLGKRVDESSLLKLLDNAPGRRFDLGETPFALDDEQPRADPTDAVRALAMVFRATEKLAQGTHLDEFLKEIVESLLDLVGAQTGVVLVRGENASWKPLWISHTGKPLTEGQVPVSQAIIEAALEKGGDIAVADVQSDNRFSDRDSVNLFKAQQVLCIPLGPREHYAGVLYINRERQPASTLESALDVSLAVARILHAGMEKFGKKNDVPLYDPRQSWCVQHLAPKWHEPEAQVEFFKNCLPQGTLAKKRVTVVRLEVQNTFTAAQQASSTWAGELISEFVKRSTRHMHARDAVTDFTGGNSLRAIIGLVTHSRSSEDMALRAVLDLRQEWTRFLNSVSAKDRLPFRAAIHSGEALVGLLGGDPNYTFVSTGPVVEETNTLLGLAQRNQILVTQPIVQATEELAESHRIGERVFGEETLQIYEAGEIKKDTTTHSGIRLMKNSTDEIVEQG